VSTAHTVPPANVILIPKLEQLRTSQADAGTSFFHVRREWLGDNVIQRRDIHARRSKCEQTLVNPKADCQASETAPVWLVEGVVVLHNVQTKASPSLLNAEPEKSHLRPWCE
jgi:hypothetical protein